MIVTSFPEENVIIDVPPNVPLDIDCEPLPAWLGYLENGASAIISCWKVTKEELDEITSTGRIWLIVYGTGTPPVGLTGQCPFERKGIR